MTAGRFDDVRAACGRITAPLLSIHGELDEAVDVQAAHDIVEWAAFCYYAQWQNYRYCGCIGDERNENWHGNQGERRDARRSQARVPAPPSPSSSFTSGE